MKKQGSVTGNIIWRMLEKVSAQLITFIVSLIIARLLEPEIYGIIALVEVFINILAIFIDSGFSVALIQKKDCSDVDFSTMFFFNVFVGIVLYLLLFIFAPFIASFYNSEILISVIRILGITIPIYSVKSIQTAYVTRQMNFKLFFYSTISGTIISAILGIYLAIQGYGIWAIVFQHLINNFIDTLVLTFTVSWKPSFNFSWQSIKNLVPYGSRVLLSRLIDRFYLSIRQLIIGKIYTKADLAFYNKGEVFPNVLVGNINSSIESVMFPVFSELQDDNKGLKDFAKKSLKVSTYVLTPMLFGLAICADTIVNLVLTSKWLFCVPYMRIFCIVYAFYSIHSTNLNILNAIGRSDLVLKIEIIKKIIGVTILLISMWFGVMAIAYGLLVMELCCQIIDTYPNRKLIDYGYFEQLKDISVNIILSLIMCTVVYFEKYLPINDLIKLTVQIVTGATVYYFLSKIFYVSSFIYIKEIIEKRLFKIKDVKKSEEK